MSARKRIKMLKESEGGLSDSAAIKAIVQTASRGDDADELAWAVCALTERESIGGYWRPWFYGDGRKRYRRIKRRIAKKLSQPFRRKKRGPLRARAAGKNEIRPRSR